ncbi:HAD family hydrolase [Solicola sp. PLA-1-18]|uniref:HAD family hydrolase n=1 Tax=Solicola sp. PLA-1-18 TaxID=3380532 RepID=UPI003B7C613F
MAAPLVVGFDLDMTLIDSRPGIGAVYERLASETGVAIDVDLVTSRLGPPVESELAHWFPADEVPALADRYRELYPELAVEAVGTMPGAHEALAAVRALGGRTVLVTAKNAPAARRHLDHLGLELDAVHGRLWREGKAVALRGERATAYVGDHVHDVEAALAAGVTAVGVTTGPCSGVELQRAGADVVLHSLLDLPELLESIG